jgi:signal transduction histidine kinase
VLVQADEFRIEQAVINLLTNAIRHSASKPIDIVVEWRNEPATGAWAYLGVRDYGKGIDPADQARIFEQFERGDKERKGSGLGLGLFIAKQIVAAHGGTLRVESQLGQGALFSLALPATLCPA